MNRTEKKAFIASLAAVFAQTSMVVVTRNDGLTVAAVTELRRKVRAAGANYKVAKNRLATLALDGTQFNGIAPLLQGPTALAWSEDPVAVAKAVVEFAKTNDKLVLLGGSLGSQVLDADGIKLWPSCRLLMRCARSSWVLSPRQLRVSPALLRRRQASLHVFLGPMPKRVKLPDFIPSYEGMFKNFALPSCLKVAFC